MGMLHIGLWFFLKAMYKFNPEWGNQGNYLYACCSGQTEV